MHCRTLKSFSFLFREAQISFPVATRESPKNMRILEMIEEKRSSLRQVHSEIRQLKKVINKAQKKLQRKISECRKFVYRMEPYMKSCFLEYNTNTTTNSLEKSPK